MNRLPIILLNGPPSCGKDLIASHLEKRGFMHRKFADALKDAATSLLGIDRDELERLKEEPLPPKEVSSVRYRDFLIALSEDFVKPWLGKAHFGRLAGRQAQAVWDWSHTTGLISYSGICYSDCGFPHEIIGCLDYLDEQGIPFMAEVWQIYRPETNFYRDSRGWIDGNAFKGMTKKILNDGSPDQLFTKVDQALQETINVL